MPVNIVEGGLAGLASVQICHRESRAGGSRPAEWRSRGQPNSHLCIVCHALVVQVLTCGTRLLFRLSQVHSDMQLHSCIVPTPRDLRGPTSV